MGITLIITGTVHKADLVVIRANYQAFSLVVSNCVMIRIIFLPISWQTLRAIVRRAYKTGEECNNECANVLFR